MEHQSFYIGRQLSRESQQWLEKQHVNYVAKPLIKIIFNEPDHYFFNRAKKEPRDWVLTSSFAAQWMVRFKDQIGLTKGDRVFCISEKQKEILKPLNIPVITSGLVSAESLGQLLIRVAGSNKTIYLFGSHSLNTIPNLLDEHRINWDGIQVYNNTSTEIKLESEYNAYLFFSPSGIENFLGAGGRIPYNASIYTIGNTTGKKAKYEFPNRVYVSPIQEEFAFIQYSVEYQLRKLYAEVEEQILI